MTIPEREDSGVWLGRLRVTAEVLVVTGGAVLTLVSAYEELHSLRDYRRDLLNDCARPRDIDEEDDNGSR